MMPAAPAFTSLLATATACFGSCWSSSTRSSIFLPSTPPFRFHSFTASSVPFLTSRPILLWSPVMGPTTPILIVVSFFAQLLSARSDSNEKAIKMLNTVYLFFMQFSCEYELPYWFSNLHISCFIVNTIKGLSSLHARNFVIQLWPDAVFEDAYFCYGLLSDHEMGTYQYESRSEACASDCVSPYKYRQGSL